MTQKSVKNPKVPVRNHTDSQQPFFAKQGDTHAADAEQSSFFSPRIQRKVATGAAEDPPDAYFPIKIPPGMSSRQEFHRYAELIIFHKVLNLNWQGKGTEEIYNNIGQHAGRTIVFQVPKSTLKKYGVEGRAQGTGDAEYGQLDGDIREAINEETDNQYYQQTGVQPGTKIKAGEKEKAAVWSDLRRQLMEQRKTLNDLPPAVKIFLQSDQTFVPANYQQLSDIAALLNQFTALDFEDYKNKVNFETTDLDALKRSIAAYIAKKEERRSAEREREGIEIKLYGLEKLYRKYKDFKKYGVIGGPTVGYGTYNPGQEYLQQLRDQEEAALTASLKEYNFNSLEEFGKYIDDYEAAFRKETIAIAGDHLQRYRHVLFEEEKKVNDDAYISKLFTEISRSGASKHFDTASDKRMQSMTAQGRGDDLTGVKAKRQLALDREATAAYATGSQMMRQLPSASPLMQENTFDNDELSHVSSKEELKQLLRAYIERKKESIDETWEDINANPDRVYELDALIVASVSIQGIADNSIYDLIIKDKVKALGTVKILKAVCFIVIGIALAVASFGTGIPALLAAGGSLMLSAYGVYEELEAYKTADNAHDVGLLSNEPTLAWVVIAILGAGADAAAVAAAFRAAGPVAKATQAFNQSGDVVTLEKTLERLTEIDARIKRNIVRAAKVEAEIKETMKGLRQIGGGQLNDITTIPAALPKFTLLAYQLIKKQAIKFDQFVSFVKYKEGIEAAKELAPHETNLLKKAFGDAGKATDKDIQEVTKIVKRAKLTEENLEVATNAMQEARSSGKFKKSGDYHGDTDHDMSDALVTNIIAHPDGVYEIKDGSKLMFLKGNDIAIVQGKGAGGGNVITAYGPSGKRGTSGVTALGGAPSDPGAPITEAMILTGQVKRGPADFFAPATKIYP